MSFEIVKNGNSEPVHTVGKFAQSAKRDCRGVAGVAISEWIAPLSHAQRVGIKNNAIGSLHHVPMALFFVLSVWTGERFRCCPEEYISGDIVVLTKRNQMVNGQFICAPFVSCIHGL